MRSFEAISKTVQIVDGIAIRSVKINGKWQNMPESKLVECGVLSELSTGLATDLKATQQHRTRPVSVRGISIE